MQDITHAALHVQRAEELIAFGARERRKKIYTTPRKSRKNTLQSPQHTLQSPRHTLQSPRHQLRWWSEADQLQYPLHVHISRPCESQAVLKLTLGNIYLERVRATDTDHEGNAKVQVNGRWSIIKKSGRYRNHIGQHLRFALDTEKEQIVNQLRFDMGDPHLVCSTVYGSQFYEYVLKDLLSNFFVRLITLFRKYERNDLTGRIQGQDITSENYPLLRLLYAVRNQVRDIVTIIDQDGERYAGDRAEAVRLLWPSITLTPLIILLRGAMQ